ncbi:reverse transcriptase domain-containing protein [Tanacetum coccineum]
MCDASDFAVGAVLGQRIDGKFKPIYYASKTLNNAQEHYTTIEKELLAVVFSFDKFCTSWKGKDRLEIADEFPDEHLMALKIEINNDEPWTVEITDKNGVRFKVNGQRLKKYHERHIDTEDKEVLKFEEYAPRPWKQRNIDEYWWRIYKSGDLKVLES